MERRAVKSVIRSTMHRAASLIGGSGAAGPADVERRNFHVLRLLCGGFLVPHIVADLTNTQMVATFYEKSGIAPAFFPVALSIEGILAFCLLLDLKTRVAAVLTAGYLIAAAVLLWRLNPRWLWNLGGVEYCVFWACCCLLLAASGRPTRS